jgi:hypothetical protein
VIDPMLLSGVDTEVESSSPCPLRRELSSTVSSASASFLRSQAQLIQDASQLIGHALTSYIA